MSLLLLKYWKQIAVVAALLGVVAWFSHARYAAGEAAGSTRVQKAWDAADAASLAAYAAAAASAARKQEADRKAAQEVEDAMQARLAASDANGRTLAGRLSDYQHSLARCRAAPAAAGAAPVADGSAGESSHSGAVDAAVAEHFAACGADALRLAGWQEWWKSVSSSP